MTFLEKLREIAKGGKDAEKIVAEACEDLGVYSLSSQIQGLACVRDQILDARSPLAEMGLDSLQPVADKFCTRHENLSSTLYLSAFAALCCRDLRASVRQARGEPKEEGEQPATGERLHRLLLLWDWLRRCFPGNPDPAEREDGRWPAPVPGRSEPKHLRDPQVREDAAARGAAGDLEALLESIKRVGGRRYPVCFPTAKDAAILQARLTAIKPNGQWPDGWPDLIVAPWSVLTLHADNMKLLRDLLKELPRLLDISAARLPLRFLVEFEPAPENPPLKTLLITGNSLDLAVCLAAWAVTRNRSLRRLCATGTVDKTDGKIGIVGGIRTKGGYKGKIDALKKIAAPDRRFLLIVPHENEPRQFEKEVGDDITINGRREHCEVHPNNLSDLFANPDILTDCFDDYRAKVLEWPEPDATALKRAKGLFKHRADTQLIVVEQFPGDPVRVAAAVARVLVQCTAEEELRDPAFAAGSPTPLLLPLEKCPPEGEDYEAGLVKALEAGIRDWRLDFTADAFFHNLLTEVVRHEPDKLWLVVYGGASLDMMSFADLQKRIDCLKEHLSHRAGHLVFVASNYHHYLMLHKHLKLEPPPAG